MEGGGYKLSVTVDDIKDVYNRVVEDDGGVNDDALDGRDGS